MAARVELRLLGGFAVAVDGRPIPDRSWSHRRAAELVQRLALAPGHRLLRDEVVDALWPDLDPDAGAANLHKAAHHARRALGARDGIVLRAGAVALFPGATVATDLEQFERAATDALAAGDPSACARLAEAYPGGDLLPGARYEPWAEPPRARARARWLELLRAGRCWARLAEAEPCDEEAHRQLMLEDLAAGRPHAALGRYRRLRAALREELGVEPSEESEQVRRRALEALDRAQPRPVGRDAELARLRAALGGARAGRVRAILIGGDEGIGKTALLERLLADAAAEGWRVVRVGADPTGGRPYQVLTEVVERLSAGSGRPAPPILEELRLAAEGRGDEADRPPPTRQQVLAAVGQVVRGQTPPAGLLIAVDDAQAADDASLRLLQILAVGEGGPLLLGLAFRTGPPAPGALERAREALAGRAVEVALGPLDLDATRALVVQRAPAAPSGAALNRVWALSAGRPALALQLAGAIDRQGQLAIPPHVWEIVPPGLEALTERELTGLEALAVAGARFDAPTAAAVLGIDQGPAEEILGAARESGLLVASPPHWQFAHEPIREALARRVPRERQRALHRDAADRLERAGAAPATLARHWLAGGRPERAVPHLLEAARRAAAVGATADALAQVDALLAHDPGHGPARLLRADLLVVAGAPSAPAAYAAAEPAAADRASLRVRQAWAMLLAGDVPGAHAALVGVEAADPATRIRLAVTRGIARWFAGQLDEAAADAAAARRLAREVGTARDVVDAAMLQAMVAHSRGEWPEALRDEVLRAPSSELAGAAIDGHLCVAEMWLYGSLPYPEVVALAERIAGEAARVGAARGEAFATTLAGEALLLSGDLRGAEERLRAGARLHRAIGASGGEALALQRLAEVAVAEARLDEARATLADALEAARRSPLSARHLLQRIYGTRIRAAGSPASALAAIADAAMAIEGPLESCPFCLPALAIPAAIAAADAGRLELASAHALAAERTIRAVWRSGGWIAALAEASAHLARARGAPAEAARLWREAELEYARSGQPLDAGRCARGRVSLGERPGDS